jgi:hypothetical protein
MELGYSVEDGCLEFDFLLLDRSEFLAEPTTFIYMNVNGQEEQIELPAGCAVYTICQTPIILQVSDKPCIQVHLADSSVRQIDGHILDLTNSRHIFQRDGVVHHWVVQVPPVFIGT